MVPSLEVIRTSRVLWGRNLICVCTWEETTQCWSEEVFKGARGDETWSYGFYILRYTIKKMKSNFGRNGTAVLLRAGRHFWQGGRRHLHETGVNGVGSVREDWHRCAWHLLKVNEKRRKDQDNIFRVCFHYLLPYFVLQHACSLLFLGTRSDPVKNIGPTHLTRSSVIIQVGW